MSDLHAGKCTAVQVYMQMQSNEATNSLFVPSYIVAHTLRQFMASSLYQFIENIQRFFTTYD